jgi:hypothetical protein
MSFTISPVSTPYAPAAVAETEISNDRQHTQQEANRRRQPHRHTETPVPDEQQAPSSDADSLPTVGTLIDARA